ncbi:MAG: hypothetical protein IJ883_07505 [Eubacterium sp.]|nr:hypothetical protein [Eubacterium sp.]
MANDGVYTRPAFYTKVVDSSGNVLLDNTKPITHTVLKSSTATLLTQGMTSVITEGTGRACKLDNMPVSGKTGTTSSSYDLWFSGFTPYLTASIWTGYDENKELAGDQSYHERLWAKIMNRINEAKKYKEKKFKISKDVKKYYGGGASGEYFAKGTEPDGSHEEGETESYDYDYDYDYNSNRTTTKSQKATQKTTVAPTKKKAETNAVAPTKKQQQPQQTQRNHWNN